MCTSPPMVVPETMPSNHSTSRMSTIVQSMASGNVALIGGAGQNRGLLVRRALSAIFRPMIDSCRRLGLRRQLAALRLAERGCRVTILEQGRRFAPEDFAASNWDVRRWLWAPRLGLRGPFRMSFLRHVTALSGVGVGGGSLVYGNVLEQPGPAFFGSSRWAALADWQAELSRIPVKAHARRAPIGVPLGTVSVRVRDCPVSPVAPTNTAVFFGEPTHRGRPPFRRRGPAAPVHPPRRLPGCRVGAKNRLTATTSTRPSSGESRSGPAEV
jgi:hypothetical protein